MNSLKKSTEAVDRRHMMVALTLARRGACRRVHAVAPGAGDATSLNTRSNAPTHDPRTFAL